MGQSSSTPQQQQQSQQKAAAAPFLHPICLQGLEGAGVSTLKQRLHLSDKRTLTVDERFLTKVR
jgi:hypothetical protein